MFINTHTHLCICIYIHIINHWKKEKGGAHEDILCLLTNITYKTAKISTWNTTTDITTVRERTLINAEHAQTITKNVAMS